MPPCIALKLKDANLKQHLMFKVSDNYSTKKKIQKYIYILLLETFCFGFADPPTIDLDALGKFNQPVIIKAGENAEWKLPFSGGAPMTIQWYKDDEELLSASNVKIATSDSESQLRLTKCQRKDSGQVKIKIKNEFGTKEAFSQLIVLGELTTINLCVPHSENMV